MSRLSTVEAHSPFHTNQRIKVEKGLRRCPLLRAEYPSHLMMQKNIYSKSSRALLLQKSLCEDYAGLIVSLCEVFPCVVGKYLNSHPIIFEIYSCFLGKKSDGW